MIKAVLFDWNGVIIDDLDAVARANCDVIVELGGERVTPETWFDEITQDWHSFFIKYGVKKEDLDKALPLMKNFYPKYSKYIKLVDGIKQVLDFLKDNGYKIGILSGVDKHSLISNVQTFDLDKYFDFMISGEDVEKHKPHPEGLLKSINYFGVRPNEILYVDDMATIFSQANKLEMKTVGFKSRISENLGLADFLIEDIKKIQTILRSLR